MSDMTIIDQPIHKPRTVIPTQFVIKRLPQDDDELWWAVRGLWGIKIPRKRVCPNHCAPFEAFADAYFARSPVSIWKASRGYGGKSMQLAVLTLTEAALLGCQITLLGGSGGQSLNIHAHTQEMWDWPNSPKALLDGPPTKFDTHLTNKGHIRAQMASQTSVRGAHPQRLRLDEIDEMDQAILEGAQGQPMRKRGIETQTVMSSTHQYPDKTMTAKLTEAKIKGWPIFEWCYKETSNTTDGWLLPSEVERKRLEIPAHMWETEYDLQEPNFGGRAIDGDMVNLCFSPVLGNFDGANKVVIEPKLQNAEYITGCDWAKQQDMTVVATFRVLKSGALRCVAWQKYNRLPWPVMVKRALTQWLTYGGRMIHDANGIGNVVDDLLKENLDPGLARQVIPFTYSTGKAKSGLYSEYVAAIERQEVQYPRITYAFDEHRYATDDDLYGTGHPPDSVVAGALAWQLRQRKQQIVLPQGIGKVSGWHN